MDRGELIYLIPYVLSLICTTAVMLYMWRYVRVLGAKAYAFIALGQSLWTFGYILELLSPTLSLKLFWDNFQLSGMFMVAIAMLRFALVYTRRKLGHSWQLWGALITASIIFLLASFTDDLRLDVSLDPGKPFFMLTYRYSPIYMLANLCTVGVAALSVGILAVDLYYASGTRRVRLAMIITGLMFPLVVSTLSGLEIIQTYPRDTAPIMFGIGMIVVIWGMLRYGLFDVVPVAIEQAVESMREAIFVLDAEDRLVHLNPAARHIIDEKISDPLGMPFPEILQVDNGRKMDDEKVHVCRDGGQVHYELNFSSLYDKRKRCIGRLILAHDITVQFRAEETLRQTNEMLERRVTERTQNLILLNERLQAEIDAREQIEAALREEKALTDAVIRSMPGIFYFHDGLRLIRWNENLEKVSGYTPQEIVEMTTLALTPQDEWPDLEEMERRTLVEGQSYQEAHILTKDGQRIPYYFTGVKLWEHEEYVVGIGIDISSQKQVEDALRQRNLELMALNSITAAVSKSLEISEVLSTLVQLLASELSIPAGSVFLRDETTGDFRLKTTWGMPTSLSEQMEGYFKDNCAGAMKVEEVRTLKTDRSACPLLSDIVPELIPSEWANCLCARLVARGKAEGWLQMIGHSAAFDERRIAFFESLGRQVGIAIQNARQFEDIRQQRKQLRRLGVRLVEVEEAERKRLAQELHDVVGQNLSALGVTLNLIAARLSGGDQERIEKHLHNALSILRQVSQSVRHVMSNLRPPELDDHGLWDALHWYAEQMTSRTGQKIVVKGESPSPPLAPSVESALFRITQEAVTNAIKHAQADQIVIHLEAVDQRILLSIEDDGVGFDAQSLARPSSGSSGWGLMIIQERIQGAGGHCRIDSAPGEGTHVKVEVAR